MLGSVLLTGCTFTPVDPPIQPPSPRSLDRSVPEGSYAQVQGAQPSEARGSADFNVLENAIKNPISPEQTSELLDEVGSNWLYGQGFGETIMTVGTIAVFPPYALWVVGNAALQLSGEEPVEIADILPEEGGDVWRTTYDEIASVPGRTTAAVSGEQYRSHEVARERIEAVLNSPKPLDSPRTEDETRIAAAFHARAVKAE